MLLTAMGVRLWWIETVWSFLCLCVCVAVVRAGVDRGDVLWRLW